MVFKVMKRGERRQLTGTISLTRVLASRTCFSAFFTEMGMVGSTYSLQAEKQSPAIRFGEGGCIIFINVISYRPSELFEYIESALLKNF